MKKVIAIATAITIAIILACSCTLAEAEGTRKPNLSDFYTEAAVITELDYEQDKVSCVTYKGEIFQFYGCFDWNIGDLITLYMWDCGTCLDVTDDEVLDVNYCGTFTPQMMANWLLH